MNKIRKLLMLSEISPQVFDFFVKTVSDGDFIKSDIEIVNNIFSFYDLNDGWNYGEGRKIKKEAILVALSSLSLIPDYENIEAFPLGNGGISLRIHFSKIKIVGLLIYSEDNICTYIDNGLEIKDAGVITMHEIKDFLIKVKGSESDVNT